MRWPTDLRFQYLRFTQHRRNAEKRGVAWQFTFDEWWQVWLESGRWDQRGRGASKYCMCRVGDHGPYAVGNVYIATNGENAHSAKPEKPLPMGVWKQARNTFCASKKMNGIKYHLGTFPTVDLALAAYQNFSARP